MGVYNEASNLKKTVESVLAQRRVSLEFIIVDDGSTDASGELLEQFATQDVRLRIFHQENAGLTAALIAGCRLATGKYIARQDAGDTSHPERLERQIGLLEERPDAVMVSCATQFVAPEDENLHIISLSDAQVAANLADLKGRQHIAHHGSAVFRRDTYERVGGYRSEFPVAQDYDLWSRLFEHGPCLTITEPLYTAKLAPGSISATRRQLQQAASSVIANAARERRAGRSDQPIVDRWREQLKTLKCGAPSPSAKRKSAAAWYYFIGCLLRETNRRAAAKYLRKSLSEWPFHIRSWIRFIQCKLM